MNRVRVAIAAALALLLAPSAASAQGFGLSAGLSVPRGDLEKQSSTGFNVNGFVNAALPASSLGFRVEAGFNGFALKGTDIGTTRIGNLTGNVLLRAPVRGAGIRPHIIAGIGAYRVNYPGGNGLTYPQATTNRPLHGAENRMGYNAGIGLTFPLRDYGGLLEVRYVQLRAASEHPSAAFVPISFGILF
jgi:hypothetical protein